MIRFNRFYKQFNFISLVLVFISLSLLIFKGLNFGIDFKGGTLIELRSNDTNINVSSLRENLQQLKLDLKLDTLILVSDDLNSIKVPPLKSIPKFNPLKIKNNKETTTRISEIILNWV